MQWPDRARRRQTTLRDVRDGARARHRRARLGEIDALIADTAEQLAARADGRPRPSDPAHGRLRAAARQRRRRRPVVINEALELARTFSTEEAVEVHQRHAGRAFRRKIERQGDSQAGAFAPIAWRHSKNRSAAPGQPRRARRSSASTSIRAGSSGSTPITALVAGYGERIARRARGRARPDDRPAAGFWHPRRSARRTSCVLSGRPREDPGLHPAGLDAGARLPDLQAARFRRLGRRRGPPVPHQDERADDLGVARCTSSRSACCRCRRSGTA